jgi:hypothetical protein
MRIPQYCFCLSTAGFLPNLQQLSIIKHKYKKNKHKKTVPGSYINNFIIEFVIHGSVQRRLLGRNTHKMQICNTIYYSKVYWRLNIFRAAHRSSSGALNCTCNPWFIYPCGDQPLPSLSGKWAISLFWVCCGWRTTPTAHSNRFQLFHDSGRKQ